MDLKHKINRKNFSLFPSDVVKSFNHLDVVQPNQHTSNLPTPSNISMKLSVDVDIHLIIAKRTNNQIVIWRLSSQSELTPILFHLDSFFDNKSLSYGDFWGKLA